MTAASVGALPRPINHLPARLFRFVALVVGLGVLGAHGALALAQSSESVSVGSRGGLSPQDQAVERALAAMTPAERRAQLLLIGFAGTEVSPFLRSWVGERGIGGVALFGRNLSNPQQIAALAGGIGALRTAGVKPFVAVDQEGGSVLRIRSGLSVMPGNMVLGASDDAVLAYLAGRATGSDLRRLGFNMNFAPVLDVNISPQNPVINVRSFGERPQQVAKLGVAYLRGQQAAGVFAVAKHFPGHGDTNADSHFAMPQVRAPARRLAAVELLPFRAAVNAGVDAIMTAHIALPLWPRAGSVPATLSPVLLQGLLRKQMQYDGIVITDDLEMQGIAQRYGLEGAVVAALQAGADMPMVLWGEQGVTAALAAIAKATASGQLSQQRIDDSARRILRAKAKRGLLGPWQGNLAVTDGHKPARANSAGTENPCHESLMAEIAARGVTVVSNASGALPLPARPEHWLVAAPAGPFLQALSAVDGIEALALPNLPTAEKRHEVATTMAARLAKADGLVAAVANRYHVDMVTSALAESEAPPTVIVSLASPYWQADFPPSVSYLCAYSALPSAQRAAAAVVLGEAPSRGRLPVSLGRQHPVGSGVALPGRTNVSDQAL